MKKKLPPLITQIMKNMKLQLKQIAFFAMLFCPGIKLAKAQIRSVGIVSQLPVKNGNLPAHGFEYNSTNYLYNLGLGYSCAQNESVNLDKVRFHTEFHLLKFHHGYLKSRLVPYVGVQVDHEIRKEQVSDEVIRQVQNKIDCKVGFKLSVDRLIVSADYQLGGNLLNLRVTYAVWVVNPCVRKRIDEFNYRAYGF